MTPAAGREAGRGSVPSPIIGIVGLILALLTVATTARGLLAQSPPVEVTQAPTTPRDGARLTWAPPVLNRPVTITVSSGHRTIKLDPLQDARIVLPSTRIDLGGGISISGGHNVVIIGGEIYISPAVSDEKDRRGLYLKDQTGTVHVEGVALTGHLTDGIDLAEAEGATVQLENIFVEHVYGSYKTNHADVIQTWAGPDRLLVDGLTATSDYQGFFLLPNQHFAGPPPSQFTFKRTLVTMAPESAYALWVPDDHAWMDASGIRLRLDGRRAGSKFVWPDADLARWGIQIVADAAGPALGAAGAPGGGYQSPGYL